jgi:hypothetical protein
MLWGGFFADVHPLKLFGVEERGTHSMLLFYKK